MEVDSIDLGICRGSFWRGDTDRVAVGLPGARIVGAPALTFCLGAIARQGWSAIQVVDEYFDRRSDPTAWVIERAVAALSTFGSTAQTLVVAKSLSTRASNLVAEREFPAVWLTPLLDDEESVEGLRRRTAPALLIGGTADPAWDGALARQCPKTS